MDNNLHPIVARMNPTSEQAKAIMSRGSDVAVTAGAGTGKTTTLVARYLSLLADEDLPPRGIVAITFTVKAAREMRNRVRREIGGYLSADHLDDHERDYWETRYSQLDAARIGTIHSLCAEVLRSHPAETGLDPDFQVLSEGLAAALRSQAVEETMAWAASTEGDASQAGVASLYPLLGVNPLESLLSTLLARRLDIRAAFESLPSDTWMTWKTGAAEQMGTFLDDPDVLNGFEALGEPLRDGIMQRAAAERDALVPVLDHLLEVWSNIEAAREVKDWFALSLCLSELRDCLKIKGRNSAWEPHRPKETISELKHLYQQHLSWIPPRGVSLALDQRVVEMLPLLHRLFSYAQERYNSLKEERRALDFDDLEQGALDLLANPSNPGVLRRWQQEIRALLVDEFQDTNDRQRQIVLLLNGQEKKLFLVGDARQSIYRFRGADVTVFRGERERIANEGGKTYPLRKSYRPHAPLLQNLNDLLRPVLGEEEDPARPWVVPFTMLDPHRMDPPEGLPAPYIELHIALGTKKGGALDRAAQALAGRLVELVDATGILLPESAGPESAKRPLNYGDIAILCRASTSFRAYEDALERAHIPYVTVAGRGFYGRPEIRDLLNLLQALADPGDDPALAGLLRSPAFALSDMALFHLANWKQEHARESRPPSLWEVLIEKGRELPDPDGERATRAIRIVSTLRPAIGRITVAEVLKALLDETGYRAMLNLAGMQRAVRNVDKLLADAHTSRMVSLGAFLEYIRTLRDVGTREGEARAVSEGAVQIMTVHAAKGLEFPVVVLGDLTYRSRGYSPRLLTDPEWGLLLRLEDDDGRRPVIYQLGRVAEKDKEDAESRRLLYVAATRAKETLLLSAFARPSSQGVLRGSGWFKWLADENVLGLASKSILLQDQQNDPLEIPLKLDGNPVHCVIYPEAYEAPVQAARQTQAPSAEEIGPSPLLTMRRDRGIAESLDSKLADEESPRSRRAWRVVPRAKRTVAPATVVGKLVHAALERWHFPDEGFDTWAEACARGCGLMDARQIQDARSKARRMLERFRVHPLCAEMEAARRLHEVPYSIERDGKIEHGIVDTLYQSDDGRWTLVEFKTNRLESESALERFRASKEYEEHERQALRYASVVEKLLGQRPRVLLCFLNCAQGVQVITV